MTQGGGRSPGPLSGVRVVDFSRIVSGPFAAQILGDLGADVVKVEFVGTGDEVRSYGVSKELGPDAGSTRPGATFLALNRNKRSIAVDVRSDRGREVALRLTAACDVVVENFRTGVMDRLRLDYEAVRERNPGVIYCSISGYGRVGPLAEAPANDLAVQAYTGLLSITGEPTRPPVRVPTPICDMGAGLFAVIGILAALNRRRDTGKGQHIATNMFEAQLNMLSYMLIDYCVNGRIPVRMGTRNRMGQPNQAFPTKDGWVCIVAANESAWQRCCEALGVPELASDERFRTLSDRAQHIDELDAAIGAATSALTTDECVRRLQEARVVCAPVNTIPQLIEHPQFAAVRAAGGIVEMPVGALGPVPLVMTPVHLSDTPVAARRPPPTLGEHTDEVLSELGFSPEEIGTMRDEGVVA